MEHPAAFTASSVADGDGGDDDVGGTSAASSSAQQQQQPTPLRRSATAPLSPPGGSNGGSVVERPSNGGEDSDRSSGSDEEGHGAQIAPAEATMASSSLAGSFKIHSRVPPRESRFEAPKPPLLPVTSVNSDLGFEGDDEVGDSLMSPGSPSEGPSPTFGESPATAEPRRPTLVERWRSRGALDY